MHPLSADEVKSLFRDVVEGLAFLVSSSLSTQIFVVLTLACSTANPFCTLI